VLQPYTEYGAFAEKAEGPKGSARAGLLGDGRGILARYDQSVPRRYWKIRAATHDPRRRGVFDRHGEMR